MSVELGRRIRGLRRLKGFTQQELAEKIDVSVSSLSNMERGVRKPRPFMLEKMAYVLEVQPEELFVISACNFSLSELRSANS